MNVVLAAETPLAGDAGLAALWRYAVWAGAVVAGGGFALLDRRIGWPVLGVLLLAMAAGGLVTMKVSPFSFGGGSYYMQGLLAAAGAGLAMIGYAGTTMLNLVRKGGGRSE